MSFVFVWKFSSGVFWLFGVDCDAADKVSVTMDRLWYVFRPWGEDSLFCILSAKDDGQLGVVDPALFPVNLWLIGSELGVSQYGFLFTYVSEEKAQFGDFISCLHL